jgi:hypothetical protein
VVVELLRGLLARFSLREHDDAGELHGPEVVWQSQVTGCRAGEVPGTAFGMD